MSILQKIDELIQSVLLKNSSAKIAQIILGPREYGDVCTEINSSARYTQETSSVGAVITHRGIPIRIDSRGSVAIDVVPFPHGSDKFPELAVEFPDLDKIDFYSELEKSLEVQ